MSRKNIIKYNAKKTKAAEKLTRRIKRRFQKHNTLLDKQKEDKKLENEQKIVTLRTYIEEQLRKKEVIEKDIVSFRKQAKKQAKKQARKYKDIKAKLDEFVSTSKYLKKTFNLIGIDRKKFLQMIGELELKKNEKFLFVKLDNSIYPLNSNNFKNIKDKIINGDKFEIGEDRTIKSSDTQMIERFLKYDEIVIITYPKYHKRNTNEAAFFPYLVNNHKLYSESWTNYGIYDKVNLSETDENCFIQSLKQNTRSRIKEGKSPIVSEDMIQTIKENCFNRNVTIKTIEDVCEKYKIRISIINGTNEHGKKYGKTGEIIKLAKIENHFFHIDNHDTNCTYFYLNNSKDLLELSDPKTREYTRKNKNGTYRSSKPNYCTSLKLVKFLLTNQKTYLSPVTLSDKDIAESNFRDDFNVIQTLSYSKELVSSDISEDRIYAKIYKISLTKKLDKYLLKKFIRDNKFKISVDKLQNLIEARSYEENDNIIYFDVETSTDGIHKVYIICSCQISKNGKIYNEQSFKDVKLFLQSIPDNSICYAHNLGYDITFLIPFLIVVGSPLIKGKNILSLKAIYKDKEKLVSINFKDSYPLISMPLKDFPKAFNFHNIEKEIINYKAYTKASIKEGCFSGREYIKDFTDEQIKQFGENLRRWQIKVNNNNFTFDHIEYSKKYCEIDVILLAKGVNKFQSYINELCVDWELPKINVHKICTIPSLVNKIFEYFGCFDNVFKVSGHVREFMSRAVVGGKTMSNQNKKWRVIGCKESSSGIEDLDKVSLYPSAMSRFEGFVVGRPKIINENAKYSDICNYSSYIVEIIINKPLSKLLDFPILSYLDENGIRSFSNIVQDKSFIVGKIMLEDVINFHELKTDDITIVRGYYYDEGYNSTIKEVINKMFQKRKVLQKNKNPMQILIKLLMNSGYGKLIQKPISTELRIIRNNEDEALKYISKNHNKIKYYEINKYNQYFVNLIKSEAHYNYTMQGVDVLDMSKRIMNEIMCLAQDLDIKIYYMDTDSIHIATGEQGDLLTKLSAAYKQKYNISLIGKDLEHFHTDFPEYKNKTVKTNTVPKSFEFIVLGKKTYLHKVIYTYVNKHNEDEEVEFIHNKMKGIPKACFDNEDVKKMTDLYLNLFDENTHSFDLAKSKAMFTKTKTWEYSISEKFVRKVSYPGKGITIK